MYTELELREVLKKLAPRTYEALHAEVELPRLFAIVMETHGLRHVEQLLYGTPISVPTKEEAKLLLEANNDLDSGHFNFA